MSLCTKEDCPLNRLIVTPETPHGALTVSFLVGSHQANVQYTPEQLHAIYNEILFMVRKYQECKAVTQLALQNRDKESGGVSNGNLGDLNSVNMRLQIEEESDPFVQHFQRSHEVESQNNTIESEMDFKTGIKEKAIKIDLSIPIEFPQIDKDKPSPYLKISFRDIFMQTGYIGLKKIEDMERLSRCVRSPLGCCYDEEIKCWAIADSEHNRVVLYPEGLTIESPKFFNPATVCVLHPGKKLAILSDICLATYDHVDRCVALVVEARPGTKLFCRGLARTPCGNLVTVQKCNAGCNVIIYNMQSIETYGEILSRIPLGSHASNPSFCAMNENRLVITDLGRQGMFRIILNKDERGGSVYASPSRRWGDSPEPEGHFEFVSGVQMDKNGWVIVADAGGGTLQLFDENLNFVARLSSDFKLPYMSSICINNEGDIMILARKSSSISRSKLLPYRELTPLEKRRHNNGFAFSGINRGASKTNSPLRAWKNRFSTN